MKKLKILSGPPCSGKTSYSNKYKDYKIISSDYEIELINNGKYNQNELNILGIENSILKINSFIKKGENKIIYDSTNLTFSRRKILLEKVKNIDIEVITFISDFNTIYLNWLKRGKDIKIEMLFYLFIIFKKTIKEEGFTIVYDVIKIEKNSFKYLKEFLEGKSFEKEKILNENKELLILDEFWKKCGKDFFEEYKFKLAYLEDIILEDKLALFYSEIKYFYNDFISNLELTYKVDYDDFIEGFFINVLSYKIKGIGLDGKVVLDSFKKNLEYF